MKRFSSIKELAELVEKSRNVDFSSLGCPAFKYHGVELERDRFSFYQGYSPYHVVWSGFAYTELYIPESSATKEEILGMIA